MLRLMILVIAGLAGCSQGVESATQDSHAIFEGTTQNEIVLNGNKYSIQVFARYMICGQALSDPGEYEIGCWSEGKKAAIFVTSSEDTAPLSLDSRETAKQVVKLYCEQLESRKFTVDTSHGSLFGTSENVFFDDENEPSWAFYGYCA